MIRVLLAHVKPLLADLISRALENAGDYEVTRSDGDALLESVNEHTAQVIITERHDASWAEHLRGVMRAHPETKILQLRGEGGDATLYELAPGRLVLGMLSPSELRAALRDALNRPTIPPRWMESR